MNTIFTHNGLVDLLQHNVVTVTFTKTNGDLRIMKCTLRSTLIPNTPKKNGIAIESTPRDAKYVAAWDLDVNNWRSFKVDSVKSVSIGRDTK